MSVRNILMAATGAQPSLNVADVFSAYPYSGTSAAQSLSPGVDLSTYGGLFWSKVRTGGRVGHYLFDSERGNTFLDTSAAANQASNTGVSLTASGVNLTSAGAVNASGYTYVGWMFRKAAKFFDVVTYTGNGNSQAISHALGVTPGMIFIKNLDGTVSNWYAMHRALTSNGLIVNSTAQATSGAAVVGASSSQFTVVRGLGPNVNTSGVSYVAYVFAHDESASGIIQCGTYTGNASITGPVVTLGWQPRYFLVKRATGGSGNWGVYDAARSTSNPRSNHLFANTSITEQVSGRNVDFLSTGFQPKTTHADINAGSSSYVYMAIRAA